MHYYTYVIHHPLGLYYVGCRQSKVPPEQDTKYWGSSQHLHKLRRILSKGWVKEILSTHDNRPDSLDMEYELTCPSVSSDDYAGVNAVIINRVRGGQGFKEYTDSMRLSRSLSNARRVVSEDTRVKMSASLKGIGLGRRHSSEARAKMSAALTGKKRAPFSPEWLEKLSKAARGKERKYYSPSRYQPKPCTIDGIKVFPSVRELVAELGKGYNGRLNPNFRYINE